MRTSRIELLKWLIGTLALPVTLLVITQVIGDWREREQQTDARLRLYTELLSKREEADTSLRKGVFDKVLETYLKPDSKDLDTKLVALELLTLNFHDTMNFSPLFWQIDREIDRVAPPPRRGALREQLIRIAEDIKARQVDTLVVDQRNNAALSLTFAPGQPAAAEVSTALAFDATDPVTHEEAAYSRTITVRVLQHDPAGRRVYATVDWSGPGGQAGTQPVQSRGFWIDAYDLPMVNYTRLSKTERLAVVLQRYDSNGALLTVLYYPSARMGEKDRPYLNDVIGELQQKH